MLATASQPLEVRRPAPGSSEQDPEAWLAAMLRAVDALAAARPRELAATRAIGLSGQMHGAVLLDRTARAASLHPVERHRASRRMPRAGGGLPGLPRSPATSAMPGFTAPKLLWVGRHEPDLFARVADVLLPKA